MLIDVGKEGGKGEGEEDKNTVRSGREKRGTETKTLRPVFQGVEVKRGRRYKNPLLDPPHRPLEMASESNSKGLNDCMISLFANRCQFWASSNAVYPRDAGPISHKFLFRCSSG